MALSLHGLRVKIAAAAMIKYGARRASLLPGGRRAVLGAAGRIQPTGQDEESGSYRGLLAQMLRDAVEAGNCAGERGLVYDPIAGLVSGPLSSLQELAVAEACFTEDPSSAKNQWRLGRVLFAAGDTSRGLDLMESAVTADPTPAKLVALAAACRKPYIARFEQALELYQQALELNPNDLRAVEGIINAGARSSFDWPLIWSGAAQLKPGRSPLADPLFWSRVESIFAQDPSPDAITAAEAALDAVAEQAHRLHQLLLEVLIVRMQFLRRFRVAAALRDAMARNRVKELGGIPLESPLWFKHLLGAYAQLGQLQKAAAAAERPPVDAATALTRLQLAKLRADVALMAGDASALQAHAAARRTEFPLPGDDAMLSLVQDRRVAVVGPAATEEDLGELIDSYDVVVRTRARGPVSPAEARRSGTRTDIAYYNGRDLGAMWEDAGAAAEAGDLKLAVARPFYATLVEEQPEWLRFTRSEFGLYFRGTSLGLQRMVYDLLQFAPAEIALFGADFYAGERSYPPGYRTHSGFGPHSPLNDIVMVHDLVFERRLMQAFCATGIVVPQGVAAEVLDLPEAEYIDRLEHSSGLH
ncbi:tetratricopeptide repeat protein [Nesterenkonia lutea]|uniref:Tetratricopeptide (TPR) repeat protein n=1 Tax=Nesterenkonia lutea TaxID=272919 RepID=A0ABR9JBX1_9MICC|nr:tetratricopeptide repeat protein [Nesterenkonia lutea]MBE1523420.1 tetratricopeptide (TPR) repeat protein [Nesterenkonia lutea]